MLRIENLSFSYENKKIFDRFSLELQKGERLAVMGESGSGKTTLLRLLSGLVAPQSGRIESDFMPPAVVFQEPRLFPHLSVRENLRVVMAKPDDDKIDELLALVELSEEADAYPSELSGGMQSRVALARALLFGSDLYLLDEPFAALDDRTRRDVLLRVKERIERENAAAILVTHREEDAELFATRTLLLSAD